MGLSNAMAQRFVNDIVSSPINICLVALICYFSYKLMKKETPKVSKASTKPMLPDMPKQDFTLEQLRPYDGVNSDGRVLMGVLGRVFDVSASSEFYGPGGPYSVFSGRDASRALATFSVDKSQFKDEHDDLSDLTPSQLSSVKEWEMQFLEKYAVVGKLLKPDESATDYSEDANNNDKEVNTSTEEPKSKKEL